MPNISAEVTNYQYEFRAMNGENAGFLYLFDTLNKLLCMAAFVERTGELSGPRQSLSGTVFLSFHRSDLSSVIDMLRNEKPVMFNWAADNLSAQIKTGKNRLAKRKAGTSHPSLPGKNRSGKAPGRLPEKEKQKNNRCFFIQGIDMKKHSIYTSAHS